MILLIIYKHSFFCNNSLLYPQVIEKSIGLIFNTSCANMFKSLWTVFNCCSLEIEKKKVLLFVVIVLLYIVVIINKIIKYI